MDPVPFFYTDNTTNCNHCSFSFSAIKHYFPHHILIICFQQARKIDTLPVSLGQCSLIVLCAGSTSTAELPSTRNYFSGTVDNVQKCFLILLDLITLVSYWGKLAAALLHTFLLGSPNKRVSHVIKHFSGAVAGEQEDFCKGSFTLPISLLCYWLA